MPDKNITDASVNRALGWRYGRDIRWFKDMIGILLNEGGGAMISEKMDPAEIVIYTHPDCPYASAAKHDLIEQGIKFHEIDVTVVPNAIEALEKLTGGDLITPVIVEGDKITVGYYGVG